MPHAILSHSEPEHDILKLIGTVATEWSWIEMLQNEMLSFFCSSDPGAMYVITQNVSAATVTGWLRTLAQIKIKDEGTLKVLNELLSQVDAVRAERNTVIHGHWTPHTEPGFAFVQTFKWERTEVAKTEMWSSADLFDLVSEIHTLQLQLANLGILWGYLKTEKPKS